MACKRSWVQVPLPPLGKPWICQEKHFFPWDFQGFLHFVAVRYHSLLCRILCRFYGLLCRNLCRIVQSPLRSLHLELEGSFSWLRFRSFLAKNKPREAGKIAPVPFAVWLSWSGTTSPRVLPLHVLGSSRTESSSSRWPNRSRWRMFGKRACR